MCIQWLDLWVVYLLIYSVHLVRSRRIQAELHWFFSARVFQSYVGRMLADRGERFSVLDQSNKQRTNITPMNFAFEDHAPSASFLRKSIKYVIGSVGRSTSNDEIHL